jgi:hypothetical protein
MIDLKDIRKKDFNLFCELYRTLTFKYETGCYSCFDVEDGFEEQDSKNIPLLIRTLLAGSYAKDPVEISRMYWFRNHEKDLDVFWLWDGDGILVFRLSDGTIVCNDDCKKSYGWSDDITWAEQVLTDNKYFIND